MPAIFPATSDWNFTPSSTALSGPLSATPGTAVPDQMLTTVGTDATVTLRALVAVWTGLPASVTFAVKFEVPAVVGIPVIAPLVALSVSPAGSPPLAKDHVYGKVPPLAVNGAE
jgi:hypothetical protein